MKNKLKKLTSSKLFSASVVAINVYRMLCVRINSLKGGTIADLLERESPKICAELSGFWGCILDLVL